MMAPQLPATFTLIFMVLQLRCPAPASAPRVCASSSSMKKGQAMMDTGPVMPNLKASLERQPLVARTCVGLPHADLPERAACVPLCRWMGVPCACLLVVALHPPHRPPPNRFTTSVSAITISRKGWRRRGKRSASRATSAATRRRSAHWKMAHTCSRWRRTLAFTGQGGALVVDTLTGQNSWSRVLR